MTKLARLLLATSLFRSSIWTTTIQGMIHPRGAAEAGDVVVVAAVAGGAVVVAVAMQLRAMTIRLRDPTPVRRDPVVLGPGEAGKERTEYK